MTSSFCFIFRSKDYTEFKTFPQCNPVVADNYDVLSNSAIGMCWCIGVHRRNSILDETIIIINIFEVYNF